MKVTILDDGFAVSMRALDLVDALDLGQDIAENPLDGYQDLRVRVIIDRRAGRGKRRDVYVRFFSDRARPPTVAEVTQHYAAIERASAGARPN